MRDADRCVYPRDFTVDRVRMHWRRQLWGTGAPAPPPACAISVYILSQDNVVLVAIAVDAP